MHQLSYILFDILFSIIMEKILLTYQSSIVKEQSTLPDEALAMIRYHSFYPWHREGAYTRFMNGKDESMLVAVQAFNPYDLYSKSDDVPATEELKVCLTFSQLMPASSDGILAVLFGAH